MEVPALVLALAISFMCNLKKQVKKTNCWAKQEGVLALVPVPAQVRVLALALALAPLFVCNLKKL